MGIDNWMLWKKYSWTQSIVNYFIVYPLITFIIWILGYCIFGQLVLPGGNLFALGILELVGVIFGHIFECIELPPLVGMMIAGLLLQNIPYFDVAKDLDSKITTPLRMMSVVILLTRGALSVNPTIIKEFRWVIPQLAIGACIIEAFVGSIISYFILGFPVPYAAAMGCIMSSMSGIATMPYLNKLQNEGLGVTNNVILIAKNACGLDAILSISMTECAFGYIFADGEFSGGLKKGLMEILMGGALAILWGSLAGIFLDDSHGSVVRTFVAFSGGSMSLLGLTTIGYPRGGPIGCFFGALIASCFWRSKGVDGKNNDKVTKNFVRLWYIFQPLLFGIMGARTNFQTVDWYLLLRGIYCLFISLSIRMCAVFFLVCFSDMTVKDKLAMSIAWIPKGTAQAALGPVALETATVVSSQIDPGVALLAYRIMNVTALIIILSSTIGGLLLLTVAPRLLRRSLP